MKTLKFVAAHWGDVIWFLTFLPYVYLCFEMKPEWLRSYILAFGLLLIYSIFLAVALTRVVILRRKCSLRDWNYLCYGVLSVLCVAFFVLIDYVPNITLWHLEIVSRTHALSLSAVIGLGLGRLVIRLLKALEGKNPKTTIAIYWGDIAFIPIALFFALVTGGGMQIGASIGSIGFIGITVVCVALFLTALARKKYALREWIYLLYGFLTTVFQMAVHLMIAPVAFVFQYLIMGAVAGFSISRLVIWLGKKRKTR